MPRQNVLWSFWTTSLPLLFAASLLGAPAVPSFADGPDVTVRLSPQQAAQFHSSLVALEAQGHVTIVAEGAPLKSTLINNFVEGTPLTEAQIRIIPSDLTLPLPLGDAVAHVAKAYDYSVERRPGIFLLRKRYKDPADLPGVTLEECTQALEDVRTLLTAFAPDPKGNWGTYAAAVVHSFSSEQQAAMRRKDEIGLEDYVDHLSFPAGLPLPPVLPPVLDTPPPFTVAVADLDPAQHQAVLQFVADTYIQDTLESLDRALPHLKNGLKTNIGVQHLVPNPDPVPYPVFGLQAPDANGTSYFYPLSSWNLLDAAESAAQIQLAHPTKAQEEANLAREEMAKNDGHVTLAQEAVVLSGRGLHVIVDPALRAKPITVVGEADSPPAQVVQAMADVYGLRARMQTDGTMALKRWMLRIPDDVSGLAAEGRLLIPDPLLRAIHMKDRTQLMDRLRNPAVDPVTFVSGASLSGQPPTAKPATSVGEQYWPVGLAAPTGDPEEDGFHLDRFLGMFLPNQIRQAALERLREAIDRGPAPAQDGDLVPLTSLTDADRGAFAISFLTEFLHMADGSFSRTPYSATHLDSYSLRIVIYPDSSGIGKEMFGIRLDPADPSGGGAHDGPAITALPFTPGQ